MVSRFACGGMTMFVGFWQSAVDQNQIAVRKKLAMPFAR
jgi:hypothetical protein